jgi:hypothetical protein
MKLIHKCANCRRPVFGGKPKVLDSYYGSQYLHTNCWDAYSGWWCERHLLLHDFDTAMEGQDSCSISWSELAELTHATQVEKFGWCMCEGTDGEGHVFDDCPREELIK